MSLTFHPISKTLPAPKLPIHLPLLLLLVVVVVVVQGELGRELRTLAMSGEIDTC